MKFTEYIRDKWFALGIGILAWFLGTSFLVVMEIPIPVIVTAEVIFAAGVFAASLYDFLRKKRYYDALSETFGEIKEKSYLSEMMEEPDFLDGRMLYRIMKVSGKYMNDMIADQKREMMEYKEYVQTWVHEVKTPIAVGQLLLENHKSEVSESLAEEFARIENYIEQMLYYSKSTSLESDYLIRPVSLHTLCMNAVQKHAKMMVAEKVLPRFGKLDYEVLADSKWMEFILGQIITNSVKYRAKEGDTWISFAAAQEDAAREELPGAGGRKLKRGCISLTVADNGIGMPGQDVPRVFTKGFTGANGRIYNKSTGMGLYLCKNLCDKMGVGAELESAEGVGTKITFYMKKA